MPSLGRVEYQQLGRTGLQVSRLCLGTMNFGPQTTEDDSHAIMDRAHELGINFFDTANSYGGQKGEGVTEQIIGRWFAKGGGRRERTVLATKVYSIMGDWPNERRLSALNIRRAADASLKRLQTDHIDLYQAHHIDRYTPFDEFWEAMEVLRQQGKILYVGSSNFAGWHLAKAQETARRRNFLGLVSEQAHYNLLNRLPEIELLPAAEDYGISVIPWSPLAGGLLSGVLKKLEKGRSGTDTMLAEVAKHKSKIEEYEAFCAEIGADPNVVALSWLLCQPAVAAPIIGPRTMAQLEGANQVMHTGIDEDTLARLDEIFPGPGHPAPEAYAW
ncbi:aldo/keto reductase [Planotetraspora kaengkrachanensis]|uniref:Oxidoreductase n=1 Tax=Planotetraspora kaengkrachanensis TaxID=575193 RepID=A0A8J3V5V8_9ACTN|nr:oxidoreductase [Planotetraspora kaengkrachanensis]